MQVNILEAKNRLSELIRSAVAGEDIVIANRGKPVARIVAEADAGRVQASGRAQAVLDWLQAHPLPAYAKQSAAQIDVVVAEERDAWD